MPSSSILFVFSAWQITSHPLSNGPSNVWSLPFSLRAWFQVDDIGALLAVATANANTIQASRGALGVLNWVGDKLLLLAHLARSNTVARSVSNIEAHYDIGNDVYRLFLDPSLTYSCGIHHPGERP